MAHDYEFTVRLQGRGNNPDEAWNDATEAFAQDFGCTPEGPDVKDLGDEDDVRPLDEKHLAVLNKAELNTVLAGLRVLQANRGLVPEEFLDETVLSGEEIDSLCQRLNLGE